jgi:outer membrane protein assembly factor BamD
MPNPSPPRGRIVPLLTTLVLSVLVLGGGLSLTGCKSRGSKDIAQSSPDVLYARAHKALINQDYDQAIKIYETLSARFPFAEQARQGKLDVLYAYYRRREAESAIDAADQFIRENPTDPRVDYAYYIKGLVEFERTPNELERVFRVDLNLRPPSTARKAFTAFKALVDQYPKSEYAPDSRQRMIYLRNRLADYEVAVARYYVTRGAWVAAAQRAKLEIEQYDGAPASREALQIMIQSYDKLGLAKLAADTRAVYSANFTGTEARTPKKKPEKEKWQFHWWRVWS